MENNMSKCPNCAGTLNLARDGNSMACPYCDSVFKMAKKYRENNMQASSQEPVQTIKKNYVEIVRDICVNSGIDSIYCAVGRSLVNHNKYQKAKQYFKIPSGEDAYLIYDATILGSCKVGFAICETGFFACAEGNNVYSIKWEEFKHVRISNAPQKCIDVGRVSFLAGADREKLLEVLERIQRSL